MTSIGFIRIITELQVSLLKKKNIIYCKNNKISSKLLSFFLNQGLIHKYILKKNKKYEIWLKSLRNLTLIKKLQLISKPGWKKYYSLYKIKTLLWKNKNYIYVISASSTTYNRNKIGLITQQEAITYKTGGELLLKIELT